MKAELIIDTSELEERVVQRVTKSLTPLLKARGPRIVNSLL